jgi:hypothetical protein
MEEIANRLLQRNSNAHKKSARRVPDVHTRLRIRDVSTETNAYATVEERRLSAA